MTPTINLNEKTKEKLAKYKEEQGYKTFSDTINLLLLKVELSEKNESEK